MGFPAFLEISDKAWSQSVAHTLYTCSYDFQWTNWWVFLAMFSLLSPSVPRQFPRTTGTDVRQH